MDEAGRQFIFGHSTHMHLNQVKVYDGQGKLKETISQSKVYDIHQHNYKEGNSVFKANCFQAEPKQCETCKKDFIPVRASQRFCKGEEGDKYDKNKCYNIFFNKKMAVPKVELVCRKCKKTFMGTPKRVWCNDPCTSYKHAPKQWTPEFKNCRQCQKPFKPKTNANAFCHEPCNFDSHRRQLRLLQEEI
jgi:hypothetical protein